MMDGSTVKPEDCRNLNVLDGDGQPIARFCMKEFQAKQQDDGTITIFRRPQALQKDSELTAQQAHAARLRRLNEEHAEFYKRGDL